MEQSQKFAFARKNTILSQASRIASSPTPYYSSSRGYAILLYESRIVFDMRRHSVRLRRTPRGAEPPRRGTSRGADAPRHRPLKSNWRYETLFWNILRARMLAGEWELLRVLASPRTDHYRARTQIFHFSHFSKILKKMIKFCIDPISGYKLQILMKLCMCLRHT